MKWNLEKSHELKLRIAQNEELLKQLSTAIEGLFKRHKIELEGKSYLFEPRVFNMEASEAPEVFVKSREAMIGAVTSELFRSGQIGRAEFLDFSKIIPKKCLPYCGPLDPFHLDEIEKFRIAEIKVAGTIQTSSDLMNRIVGNKALLKEMSKTVFDILKQHKIIFERGEGCVLTPVVFDKPVYAQKLATIKESSQLHGFGPEILFDSNPLPARTAGFIELAQQGRSDFLFGVNHDFWWWVGIPAPEILAGLDMMRKVK